jgi:hypothetical protein
MSGALSGSQHCPRYESALAVSRPPAYNISGLLHFVEREDPIVARKYNPEKLKQAAADWDIHHALVAAVRRLVRLAGGVQEAKDVIDAIAAADALEEEKEEGA